MYDFLLNACLPVWYILLTLPWPQKLKYHFRHWAKLVKVYVYNKASAKHDSIVLSNNLCAFPDQAIGYHIFISPIFLCFLPITYIRPARLKCQQERGKICSSFFTWKYKDACICFDQRHIILKIMKWCQVAMYTTVGKVKLSLHKILVFHLVLLRYQRHCVLWK